MSNSNKQPNINMFDIGKKLGEGRFGMVFLVTEKESNFFLALKMIKKSEVTLYELEKQIKREIEIHRNLHHPNIIISFGHFEDHKRIYIMLEYAPNGDLSSDIRKYGPCCNTRAATYMYQLADALKFCHSNFVMHRDIKPSNIFIAVNGQIKLADFGWAMHKNNSKNRNYQGTLEYRAPEICQNVLPGYEADVWSVGIVLYEMLTGNVPFDDDNQQMVSNKIITADYVIPPSVHSGATDLIRKILQIKPEERLQLEEILVHSYISDFSENTPDECRAAKKAWAQKGP